VLPSTLNHKLIARIIDFDRAIGSNYAAQIESVISILRLARQADR